MEEIGYRGETKGIRPGLSISVLLLLCTIDGVTRNCSTRPRVLGATASSQVEVFFAT
jgi:hypothetical protein